MLDEPAHDHLPGGFPIHLQRFDDAPFYRDVSWFAPLDRDPSWIRGPDRTIAIIDIMADSPLGQVVMVPMLAWIAREAPNEQKATYFAVMAAFTNLALSAANLGTKYLNRLFVVERGNYSELGLIMVTAAITGLIVPPMTVMVVNLWKRPPSAGGAERSSSDSKTDLKSAAKE